MLLLHKIQSGSVEDAALVGGDHILDVNEGILSSRLLEQFQGLSDEVAQVESFSLAVFDLIADAGVVVAEDVEDGQDLPIVGHQCFSDHLTR